MKESAKALRKAASEANYEQVVAIVNNEEIIQFINERGDESGKTALHFASGSGNIEIVRKLLEKGANINAQDNNYFTPVMIALLKGHSQIVLLFLENKDCQLLLENNKTQHLLKLAYEKELYLHQESLFLAIKTQTYQQATKQWGDIKITKNGDIKKQAAKLIARSRLPAIIFSIPVNTKYFYPFIKEQLNKLWHLGYKEIGLEYIEQTDPETFSYIADTSLMDEESLNKFHIEAIGCALSQRISPHFAKILPKLIAEQFRECFERTSGGTVFILNSKAVNIAELREKLRGYEKNIIYYIATNDESPDEVLSEKILHLSLQNTSAVQLLAPGKHCYKNFWDPIEQFLVKDPKVFYYNHFEGNHLLTRLKRVSEEFEAVRDRSNKIYAKVRLQNLSEFHTLCEKLERKYGYHSVLQWAKELNTDKRELTLVVSNLSKYTSNQLPQVDENDTNRMLLIRLINEWVDNTNTCTLADFNNKSAVTRFSLKLPLGEEIPIKKGLIVKVEFIKLGRSVGSSSGQPELETAKATLILTLRNHAQIIISLENRNNETTIYLTDYVLRQYQCNIDESFTRHDSRILTQWQRFVNYKPEVAQFYQTLHKTIGNELVSRIDKKRTVTLFSFGCYNGDELITIRDNLQANEIVCGKLFGIDINSNNFPETNQISFITENVLHLKKVVDGLIYDNDSLKIAFFLGILKSGSMQGTYESLYVLQQARIMDLIIISAGSDSYVNKSLLKGAGFCYETKFLDNKCIYYVEKMSASQRRRYLENRSKKRSSKGIFDGLDLSYSANPLFDLGLFSQVALEEIKQVDISWCHFIDDEMALFFQEIAAIKTDMMVICSNNQQAQMKEFTKLYPAIKLYERCDMSSHVECPLFTPAEARKLGVYRSPMRL